MNTKESYTKYANAQIKINELLVKGLLQVNEAITAKDGKVFNKNVFELLPNTNEFTYYQATNENFKNVSIVPKVGEQSMYRNAITQKVYISDTNRIDAAQTVELITAKIASLERINNEYRAAIEGYDTAANELKILEMAIENYKKNVHQYLRVSITVQKN